MINIKNLYKKYGDLTVFKDFNLSIESGKITCVLGESGSGKTTLLNCVSRLTDYAGEIDKIECSYAFSKPNLFPNLTVKDNLLLVNNDVAQVENCLKEFGILDKKDSYPRGLSNGQAQRVSLARAILYKKPLLLLDEPFSSLDIGIKYRLIEKIKKRQQEEQNTILMVTHDIKEAVTIADRIVVIKKGKIIYDNNSVQKKTEKEIFDLLMINGL